jgi:hypothetical protein
MLSLRFVVLALAAVAEAGKLYGCAVSVESEGQTLVKTDHVPGNLYRQGHHRHRLLLKQQPVHLLLRYVHGDHQRLCQRMH